MTTGTHRDPLDLDDAQLHDDPVVLVLAVAIVAVFAVLLTLALVWVR